MDVESPQRPKSKEVEEEKVETLRTDKSQATMANFIPKDIAK
jgi:hypothetical protein